MNKPLLTLTAIILAAATGTGHAETRSYQWCVDYARENNITLRKSLISQNTAEVDLSEAKGAGLPTLSADVSQGVSTNPWNNGNKSGYTSSYGLNAGWTVWNGGEREATIRRSEIETEISRLDTDAQMQSLETGILEIYLNLLYARESITICEQAEALSLAQAERAKAMMESGRVSRVDYAQLNSQYEQDKYATVNARATYETRCMELKKLLELGIDETVEPEEIATDENALLASLPDMAATYRLALSNDRTLESLTLGKEAADADIEIARAGGKPKISLNGGVGTGYNAPGISFGSSMKQSLGANLGVTLSVPIADGRKTRSAVARARLQKLDSDLDIEQRETLLAQNVENTYIDTRSAQARYTAALSRLEATEISNDLTNEQFALGLVNPVELLTAHNNLMEAKFTVLQAKYMALLGLKMIEYYRDNRITLQ